MGYFIAAQTTWLICVSYAAIQTGFSGRAAFTLAFCGSVVLGFAWL